jgi:D-glycero-D-manno-heptose 1,7-bisphosphate phosphatase
MRLIFSNPKRSRGPAIFIDRDGVINHRRENSYVLEWRQFFFIPGIIQALREIASVKLPLIMVSNQAAVGRSLMTVAVLEDITTRMQSALQAEGAPLSAAYYCTHRREDHCACRKPKPGLLQQAAADFDIDLSQSVFIGDADSDVRAAGAAGCHPVLFGPGLYSGTSAGDWREGVPLAGSAELLFSVTTEALRVAEKRVSVSGTKLVLEPG